MPEQVRVDVDFKVAAEALAQPPDHLAYAILGQLRPAPGAEEGARLKRAPAALAAAVAYRLAQELLADGAVVLADLDRFR